MTDPSDDPAKPGADPPSERIAKALARAGIASRRDVERMIAAGRVSVDGAVLTTPAFLIDRLDRVRVDGKPVGRAEASRLWRYHKPRGVVTTDKDPEGRPTVQAQLPTKLGRVVTVGRLDVATEGLLLLTNDGELARWMELPVNALPRRYKVRVFGTPDAAALAGLAAGITVDGVAYGPVKAMIARRQTSNAWLDVTLYEGKNREIRKLMRHLGLEVNRLIRQGYGPFHLGQLKPGQVEPVPVKTLRDGLPGFFETAAGTQRSSGIAAPPPDPSKWAKAAAPKAKSRAQLKARAKPKAKSRPATAEDAATQAKPTKSRRTLRAPTGKGTGRGPAKRG
jgi:23S rRNA pseudouridine2605 synthase